MDWVRFAFFYTPSFFQPGLRKNIRDIPTTKFLEIRLLLAARSQTA